MDHDPLLLGGRVTKASKTLHWEPALFSVPVSLPTWRCILCCHFIEAIGGGAEQLGWDAPRSNREGSMLSSSLMSSRASDVESPENHRTREGGNRALVMGF